MQFKIMSTRDCVENLVRNLCSGLILGECIGVIERVIYVGSGVSSSFCKDKSRIPTTSSVLSAMIGNVAVTKTPTQSDRAA